MDKILVTDSLFIFDEHVKQLEDAGYAVERLDKTKATEEELIQAVRGKVGYILGGVEKVTDKVIQAGDSLQAIVFTGTAWDGFVTGKDTAQQNGVKIANTPHLNAGAVAEWVFSTGMAMSRHLFALGRTGDKTLPTSLGLSELQVGIVGLGHVGERTAALFTSVGANVSYWSQSPKESQLAYKELDTLLAESDLVLVCVSAAAGAGWLDGAKLSKLKPGAVVNCLTDTVLNEEDLLAALSNGGIRAYLDWTPKSPAYKNLPVDTFYCSNQSTAYNTRQANKAISDAAVSSLINLLQTGEDKYRVL